MLGESVVNGRTAAGVQLGEWPEGVENKVLVPRLIVWLTVLN